MCCCNASRLFGKDAQKVRSMAFFTFANFPKSKFNTFAELHEFFMCVCVCFPNTIFLFALDVCVVCVCYLYRIIRWQKMPTTRVLRARYRMENWKMFLLFLRLLCTRSRARYMLLMLPFQLLCFVDSACFRSVLLRSLACWILAVTVVVHIACALWSVWNFDLRWLRAKVILSKIPFSSAEEKAGPSKAVGGRRGGDWKWHRNSPFHLNCKLFLIFSPLLHSSHVCLSVCAQMYGIVDSIALYVGKFYLWVTQPPPSHAVEALFPLTRVNSRRFESDYFARKFSAFRRQMAEM